MSERVTPLDKRETILQLNQRQLERLAFNAIRKGLSPTEFVVVPIDVDDPTWTELVDYLMPNQNWDQYRTRGEKPFARGSVRSEIIEYLIKVVPDIAAALTNELPQGTVRGIVMGSGGASVYYIQPDSHAELN